MISSTSKFKRSDTMLTSILVYFVFIFSFYEILGIFHVTNSHFHSKLLSEQSVANLRKLEQAVKLAQKYEIYA